MGVAAHPKRRRLGWLIFLATFVIYQANMRPIASGDTLPTALLPFSILLDQSVRLDRFVPILQAGQSTMPYYLHQRDIHFYSTYPLAQPILLTPLYIPIFAAIHPERWETGDVILLARVLEKLVAGAMAAASVAFFFMLLDRLTSRRNALILSIAHGFGTTTWAISSQALWQHSGGELLLVLTLLALQQWIEHEEAPKFLWLAGAWAGLALMVRSTDGLLACAVVLALVRRRSIGALASFLPPLLICGTIAAAWNLWLFQDLRGAYGAAPVTHHVLQGLAGILFSPGRGLLIYCPFFLFAAAGFWRKWNPGTSSLLLAVSAIYCVAHLILVSFIATWWGGQCWGPRYLTEIMPFLTLLILPALDAVMESPWQRALFLCLLAYSISVQFVGVFCYPNGAWDTTPISADDHPERFWAWSDNPIGRTVRGGVVLQPHAIVLEGALHGKAAAIRRMREARYRGF